MVVVLAGYAIMLMVENVGCVGMTRGCEYDRGGAGLLHCAPTTILHILTPLHLSHVIVGAQCNKLSLTHIFLFE